MHLKADGLVAGIQPRPVASVLLMPGSLLIFNGEAYEGCLHGIDEVHHHTSQTVALALVAHA